MYNLIDRDELIKRARPIENFPNGTMVVVLGVVKSLPTVDAKPVRYGRWKDDGCCSLCGNPDPYYYFITEYKSYYCPHCGAEMNLEK